MRGLNEFIYEGGEFIKKDNVGCWIFRPVLTEGLISINVSFQVKQGHIIDKRELAIIICGERIDFKTKSEQVINDIKNLFHELLNSNEYKQNLNSIAEGFKMKIEGDIVKSRWVMAEIHQ